MGWASLQSLVAHMMPWQYMLLLGEAISQLLASQVRRTRSFQDIRASIGSRQQAVGKAGNNTGSGGKGVCSRWRSALFHARR